MAEPTRVPVEQRLIFGHVVEGLFLKALKPRLTTVLIARLRVEAGIDLEKRLELAYPLTAWHRGLMAAAEVLYPELTRQEGLDDLGACLVRGYFDTLLGSALAAVLKLIGPARALRRATHNLRTGNNYAESRLTERAPNHFLLWTNETGDLRYNLAGVVRQALTVAGAPHVEVAVSAFDDDSTTYDVTWDL